ncbi:MAG: universal stress protein [Actinomyces ruminicola]|uniref:Nucleotide-binding universal stress protein, UspA family n=1 Tax=Actinomyces ruminicola TaxID=332524 RepID=A0A1G9UY44_9ACTO|nr:universal stress protein [Actinomyces ruminicola]MBE6482692.1 universal stress protein [Actinomyces ruminicola]SDM64891.1 Nucleotide-binding universal stress protein, UspA family [Actinomyces ruminicola]
MAEDKVVLVGVDGSPESLEAVDWAVDRAACNGWRVHILCAYSLPSFTTASLDGGYAALDDSAVRAGAEAVVNEAVARAQGRGVTVTSSLETGDPAGVLVDLSADAALAVVGTRGGGGFADRLLGTVSSALPAHSRCPAVVVPRHTEGSAFTPVRRIVVGVDGSDSARKALRRAVREADAWGAELTAIAAVPMASGAGALAWLPAAVDREQVLTDVRSGLDRAIAEATEGYPDVVVRRHALDGNAAELLSEFSTAVDLVVVGSRGRGGFSGLLLGSVSQAVLSHASCPIMVVPARTREEDARVGRNQTTPWERA